MRIYPKFCLNHARSRMRNTNERIPTERKVTQRKKCRKRDKKENKSHQMLLKSLCLRHGPACEKKYGRMLGLLYAV